MTPTERIQLKIFSGFDDFAPCLRAWQQAGETVVFTNGCFDLLHRGHTDYLAQSAGLGTRLVVGLNTDASVGRLKGTDRPLVDEQSRALVLASLLVVDAVVLFDEDTPYELIGKIKPQVLVKGNDYQIEEIAGFDLVLAAGGRVETIPLTEGFSSSALMEKIRNS